MNISDLFSAGGVEQFKSIEENLLNRKQNGKIAGTLALITAIGQALILLWPILKEILAGGGEVDLRSYFVSPFNYILLLFVVFFLVIYFIFRRTSFLLKATKEPFRYTFYVEEFQKIDTVTDGFELKKLDRLKLLSHDLTELINKRIKRFSILKDHRENDDKTKQLTDTRKSSHVRIFGSYSVREDRENGDWIIHIMPYIQIGNLEAPATLAQSVRFSLTTDETPDVLDAREYNQLLERVYSRVTTEIYARIKQDIDNKIKLFPTSFLQENALFQEAQDMAASNTINAFDSAIGLYEKAMKKSASSFRINFFNLLFKITPLRSWLIHFLHHYARIRIGHSLCLIYKKRIATLSGRSSNPIFEIRQNMKRVVNLLELVIFTVAKNRDSRDFSDDQKTFFNLAYLSYPADNWFRKLFFKTSKKQFDETREILFNAYVVHALSDTLLNSFIAAREKLDNARSLAPDLSNESVLFILAEGYVEPNIDKAILLFRQASEKDPAFQIAQYDLAFWSEMRFRKEGATDKDRAMLVLDEYDKVLKINPGNIAALAAQGYILWVLKDLNKARRKFEEGIEVKALVSETFVGILWYGLARVYAEKGFMTRSYDFYSQAITSSPNLGAYFMYDNSVINISFYEYITPGLLKRFDDYKNGFDFFRKQATNHLLQLHDDKGQWHEALQEMKTDELTAQLHHTGLFSGPVEITKTKKSDQWKVRSKSDDLMPLAKEEEYLLTMKGDYVVISQQGSEKLFTLVSSFVLNDIGNAALNYFRRYGDRTELNKAVILFEEAIQLHADNILAKYNKSLALLYQKPLLSQIEQEDIDSEYIRELLEISTEVIENYPNWMEGLVSYFEILKRTRQDLVTERQGYRDKIKGYKSVQSKTPFQFQASGTDKLQSSGGLLKGSQKTNLQQQQNVTAERKSEMKQKPELSYDELISRESQCTRMMEVIDKKIEVVVWKTIESTSYDALYDGLRLGDFSSAAIQNLLAKDIQWGKLNEMDARSLKLYTTACQYFNTEFKKEEYGAINSLFNHLLDYYYPEDFDIFLLKRDLLYSIADSKKHEAELYQLLSANGNFALGLADELKQNQIPDELEKMMRRLGMAVEKDHDCVVDKSENDDCVFTINCKNRYDLSRRRFMVQQRGKASLLFESVIDHCDVVLKSFTLFSLAQDKINFEYLNYYARYYLSKDAYINCLRQALSTGVSLEVLDLLANEELKSAELIRFVNAIEVENYSDDRKPAIAKIYNRLGIILYDEAKITDAIPYYQKAIELDPQKPIYQNNLGLMYSKMEPADHKMALKYYEMAIETRKSEQDDEYSMEFYFEGWTESLFHTNKLAQLEPGLAEASPFLSDELAVAKLFNRIGNLIFRESDPNGAIPYYDLAISVYPNWPIFHANLGLMYAGLTPPDCESSIENYREAIQLRKLIEKDDYDLAYYYESLAESMFKCGRMDAFINELEAESPGWLPNAEKANIHNRIGNLYYNENRVQEAIDFYRRAIELNPSRPIFYANLGLMYSSSNPPEYERAAQQYQQAVEVRKKLETDDFSLNYFYEYLADSSFRCGRMDEFVGQFEHEETTAFTADEKASVCNQVGNLYYQSNDFETAGRWYDKAIGLFPTRPIFWANRGLVFQSLDPPNYSESFKFYGEAARLRRQIDKDEYSLAYYMGYWADSAQRCGKLSEFFLEFDANEVSQNETQELATFYNLLGNLLFRDLRVADAIPYYQEAIQLAPNRPIFYANLGLMYSSLRRPNFDAALFNYETALEIRKGLESDEFDLSYYENELEILKERMAAAN